MANDMQDPPATLEVQATLTFDPQSNDQFVYSGSQYVDPSGDLAWPQVGGPVNVSISLPAGSSATFNPAAPLFLQPQTDVPSGQCPSIYDPGQEFSGWSLTPDNKTLMFTDYNNDLATYLYSVNVTLNGQSYQDDPRIINQV